jgi:hypothetical protein
MCTLHDALLFAVLRNAPGGASISYVDDEIIFRAWYNDILLDRNSTNYICSWENVYNDIKQIQNILHQDRDFNTCKLIMIYSKRVIEKVYEDVLYSVKIIDGNIITFKYYIKYNKNSKIHGQRLEIISFDKSLFSFFELFKTFKQQAVVLFTSNFNRLDNLLDYFESTQSCIVNWLEYNTDKSLSEEKCIITIRYNKELKIIKSRLYARYFPPVLTQIITGYLFHTIKYYNNYMNGMYF